jgi:hypothetical protein
MLLVAKISPHLLFLCKLSTSKEHAYNLSESKRGNEFFTWQKRASKPLIYYERHPEIVKLAKNTACPWLMTIQKRILHNRRLWGG